MCYIKEGLVHWAHWPEVDQNGAEGSVWGVDNVYIDPNGSFMVVYICKNISSIIQRFGQFNKKVQGKYFSE